MGIPDRRSLVDAGGSFAAGAIGRYNPHVAGLMDNLRGDARGLRAAEKYR